MKAGLIRTGTLAGSVLVMGSLWAAGDFSARYDAARKKEDAAQAEAVLREWKAADPEDPEAYISAANFYFEQAGKETVDLTTKPPGPGDFAVVDPKSGKTAGSIAVERRFDPAVMDLAVANLSEALDRFPDRLDIWLGQAALLEYAEKFEDEYAVLEKLCDKAADPGMAWIGKNGKAYEHPRKTVAEALHSRTLTYLNQETEPGDERAMKLAQLAVRYFPEHPYAYNTIAVLYSYKKNWGEACRYLERALKIAPEDTLVMYNLGKMLIRAGDKDKARGMFEKVISLAPGSPQAEDAKKDLESLGKSEPDPLRKP